MKKKQFLREMREEVNRFEAIVADTVGILVSQAANIHLDREVVENASRDKILVKPQDGNDFVPCPICHQMLKPVGAEEHPVIPAHNGAAQRLVGNHLEAAECSGSYFPVSNLRPGD